MEIIENGNACSEDGVSLTPKQDNRRIACNMRDVMNSTKKKERQHHRRKKENIKKFEPEITDISSIMNDTLNIVSPNVSVEEVKDNKTPLKENSSQISAENQKNKKRNNRTKVLCRDPAAVGSIKAHFSPKPKAGDPMSEEGGNPNKKMNAFEVMMNARNKSIGSNTPGKDLDKADSDVPSAGEKSPAAVKRKLVLEDWAEKKGASKRKIDDEARGEYIELEMKKRAKRLKGMLINGKDSSTSQSTASKDVPNRSKKSKNEQKVTSDIKKIDEPVKEQLKQKSKKQKASKGPRKKRIRRISSSDADDCQDKAIGKIEDVEFVSKLSSPIKKRDSLLGYFSKVVSPNSSSKLEIKHAETETKNTEEVIETELKFNGNISKTKSKRKSELNKPPTSVSTPTSINSSRPKRSCTGKARYDYDLEVSPSKSSDIEANSNRRSKRHIKMKAVAIEDIMQIDSKETIDLIDVIDLDVSIGENISKTNGFLKEMVGKKLAPVFVKAVPKPAPDPEKMKARQEFLMSGVPEKMRIEMAKQRQFESFYENEAEYFPKVSHVLQIDPEGVPHLGNKTNRITLKSDDNSPIINKIRKLKAAILIEPSLKLNYVPLQKLPDIENKRMFVKELKGKYDKFPTYRCYNQLREKYRSFSAKDTELDTQQLTESFVVTSSSRRHRHKQTDTSNPDDDKPPLSAPNGELLFTDKYKPMTSEQVLVNIAPVQELREFLSSWQIGRNSKLNDSYIDFEINDSSSNSTGLSNSVVLLGPSSSGKTNAVFALANELNFNVLEINAGMKRTGKKLLQELQESTQSHQVGKDNAKNNLLKLSLNGLKKRMEINDSNSSLDHSPSSSSKLSLILVEDADIVFDQDAGFTEAIYQLSATSKRPVIIIASDPNCQHLLRLINQHSIAFAKPNVLNISKFLSILSLIENCPIDLDDIVSLYLYNHRNLRKTLLEMQFFIQSGGDRMRRKANNPHFVLTSPTRLSVESDNSKKDDQEDHLDQNNEKSSRKVYVHKTLFEFYTTCQNVGRIVPFPIDFNILWENLGDIFKITPDLRSCLSPKIIGRRISPRKKNNPKRKDELQTLTEFYENISTAVCITPNGHVENDFCQPRLVDEISHHLVEKSLKINLNAGVVSYNLFSKEKDRTLLTSYISSHQLRPKRSVALDYEPCLRSICRSEKDRSYVERRGSRFYHYLRNTCNNLNTFSTDLFDNSCSMLIDKKE